MQQEVVRYLVDAGPECRADGMASMVTGRLPGVRLNIKMSSYQYLDVVLPC